MRIWLIIFTAVTLCGCAVVPTDMFPKFTWYWSADAKAHRQQQAAEKQWEQTNNITK